MPFLKKPKKKYRACNSDRSCKLYNNTSYRKLRQTLNMQFPICVYCWTEGVISPAAELHHITPVLSGETEEEQIALLLNPDNIVALCENHHHLVHYQYNTGHFNEISHKLKDMRDKYIQTVSDYPL